jgi:hypothetical protein
MITLKFKSHNPGIENESCCRHSFLSFHILASDPLIGGFPEEYGKMDDVESLRFYFFQSTEKRRPNPGLTGKREGSGSEKEGRKKTNGWHHSFSRPRLSVSSR